MEIDTDDSFGDDLSHDSAGVVNSNILDKV